MREILILLGIETAGALVTFRYWAWFLVARKDIPRRTAIREGAILAPFWPFALLGVILYGVYRLVTAGIPTSESERAEEIAALEREVLDEMDEVEDLMSTIIREALQEPPEAPLTCSRCGCDVVPGRRGHVHVPTLGGPSACSWATVDPESAAMFLTGQEPGATPWYLTPEDSPEREAVRRRTEEALSKGMNQREVADLPRESPWKEFHRQRREIHRRYHSGGFKSCPECNRSAP